MRWVCNLGRAGVSPLTATQANKPVVCSSRALIQPYFNKKVGNSGYIL